MKQFDPHCVLGVTVIVILGSFLKTVIEIKFKKMCFAIHCLKTTFSFNIFSFEVIIPKYKEVVK